MTITRSFRARLARLLGLRTEIPPRDEVVWVLPQDGPESVAAAMARACEAARAGDAEAARRHIALAERLVTRMRAREIAARQAPEYHPPRTT
ncbi:hypothetical protein [Nocardia crassostreae]|uniref:hypothetical protein n=1 Tax=Nocardia crassostreae TaxID=53428 RepID=UPI000831415F|nr:hypothetical protein [Nocardia crassostreae]